MLEEKQEKDLTLFNKFFDYIVKGEKCYCGLKLFRTRMTWYPHCGGIYVPTEKEKQWVYIVCRCGSQISWKKILGRHL